MKIKVAIDNLGSHIRIHSKSRSKYSKVHTDNSPRKQRSLFSPSLADAKTIVSQKYRSKQQRVRSTSKYPCDHKRKRDRQKQCQGQYYGYQRDKRESWQRERQELLRQNEKLRRENRVLNEYFEYFQTKQQISNLSCKERLFTFKEIKQGIQSNRMSSKRTIKTPSTKPNSKVHELDEYS